MSLLGALQPFVKSRAAAQRGRGCELCGAPLEAEHRHLADVQNRTLACACRGCAILFSPSTASGGRWRTVPDRHIVDAGFTLTDPEWDSLGIPVGLVFFIKSSSAKGWTAVYPSPAGPVESLLRLDAWSAIASQTFLVDTVEPDVEALLVTATGDHLGYQCMLVPVHACYALVGKVRRRWRGLDGGEEARLAIAEHIGALRARCEVTSREHA